MSIHQSPATGPAKSIVDRALATFDRVALSMLYVFVVAGLPMVAYSVLSQAA